MAYIDDLVVYNGHLANYKKGLLSLQDIQAKYNTIKSAYNAEMVIYNKALQDLQALLNTEGYINRPLGQPLVFTSEPNATKSFSGDFQYMTPAKAQSIVMTNTIHTVTANDLNKGPSDYLWVDSGRTFTVTYTNLSRSFMESTKIEKIVYTITHLGVRPCMFQVYQDPARTIWCTSFAGDCKFRFRPAFYDKGDAAVNLTCGFTAGFADTHSEMNVAVGRITKLADGWARFQYTNTTSSVQRFEFYLPKIDGLTENQLYTFLQEVRNNKSSTSMYFYFVQDNASAFWGNDPDSALQVSGNVKRTVRVPKTNTITLAQASRLVTVNVNVPAGATLDVETRISCYAGNYLGPYIPYQGSKRGVDGKDGPKGDKGGKVIPLANALFALNSLNSQGTGQIQEYVSNFSGIEPITINGSSVKNQNGTLIAPTRNDWKHLGSRWDATEWDVFGSPYEWYGAGVGLVNADNPSLIVGNLKGGDIWFSFNGRVSSKGTPTKPTQPEAPTIITVKPWAIRKSGAFRTLNRPSGFFKRRLDGAFVDKSNQHVYDINKSNQGSHRIRKSSVWTGQNKIGAN